MKKFFLSFIFLTSTFSLVHAVGAGGAFGYSANTFEFKRNAYTDVDGRDEDGIYIDGSSFYVDLRASFFFELGENDTDGHTFTKFQFRNTETDLTRYEVDNEANAGFFSPYFLKFKSKSYHLFYEPGFAILVSEGGGEIHRILNFSFLFSLNYYDIQYRLFDETISESAPLVSNSFQEWNLGASVGFSLYEYEAEDFRLTAIKAFGSSSRGVGSSIPVFQNGSTSTTIDGDDYDLSFDYLILDFFNFVYFF